MKTCQQCFEEYTGSDPQFCSQDCADAYDDELEDEDEINGHDLGDLDGEEDE